MIVVNKKHDLSFTLHFTEEQDRQDFLECLNRGMNTWQKQFEDAGKNVRDAVNELSQ